MSYKLLVWFKDVLGNLKCAERAFDVEDNCVSIPPTPLIYIEPPDGATVYSTSVTLKWFPAANATSYDVYFDWKANPDLEQADVTETEYTVTVLPGRLYYWKIVAKGQGVDTEGEVRNFRTAESCTAPVARKDLNSLAVDPAPCAKTGIKITWPIAATWNDSCNTQCDRRRYQILRDGVVVHSRYGPWGASDFVEGTPAPGLTWTDTAAAQGVSYTYKVRYFNQCDLSDDTNTDTATDHAYAPIVPEVQVGPTNACPAQTVRLTASSGTAQFQWYLNNTAIPGATSNYYDASQSGSYKVGCLDAHYCDVVSDPEDVVVQACPNIQFLSAQAPTQVVEVGDDDGVIEPGERWRIKVTLTNNGTAGAGDVAAVVRGAWVEVYLLSGGPVMPYLSVVDNRTGDAVYVAAVKGEGGGFETRNGGKSGTIGREVPHETFR